MTDSRDREPTPDPCFDGPDQPRSDFEDEAADGWQDYCDAGPETCPECDGSGIVVGCCDDICHGRRGGGAMTDGLFGAVEEQVGDELLTHDEAAELLGFSARSLFTFAKQRNEIPRIEVRGKVRYRRSDLESWIQSQITEADGVANKPNKKRQQPGRLQFAEKLKVADYLRTVERLDRWSAATAVRRIREETGVVTTEVVVTRLVAELDLRLKAGPSARSTRGKQIATLAAAVVNLSEPAGRLIVRRVAGELGCHQSLDSQTDRLSLSLSAFPEPDGLAFAVRSVEQNPLRAACLFTDARHHVPF